MPAIDIQFESHICDVCRLLDHDESLKPCFFCSLCNAWICQGDARKWVRRLRAMAAAKGLSSELQYRPCEVCVMRDHDVVSKQCILHSSFDMWVCEPHSGDTQWLRILSKRKQVNLARELRDQNANNRTEL